MLTVPSVDAIRFAIASSLDASSDDSVESVLSVAALSVVSSAFEPHPANAVATIVDTRSAETIFFFIFTPPFSS